MVEANPSLWYSDVVSSVYVKEEMQMIWQLCIGRLGPARARFWNRQSDMGLGRKIQ